jgi:hypothetical protein
MLAAGPGPAVEEHLTELLGHPVDHPERSLLDAGWCIGTAKAEMPRCLATSWSVRASRRHHSASSE